MNKRLLAILLVIVGILAIVGILWFFFFNKPKTTVTPQQPGQNTVTPSVPFDPSTSVPTFEPPTGTPPDPNSAEEKERQAQEKLRRIAMNYGARLGTYSADDGFEGVRDSQAIATADFQPRLAYIACTQLLKDHPVGSHWSQEARSITSAIEPYFVACFW
jgi:type IV secretory pathway VirB10-like protein